MIQWISEINQALVADRSHTHASLQDILSSQPLLTRVHLEVTVEWTFIQCEERFPGEQAIPEGACMYLMSFLSQTPLRSLRVLELVAWACISISAKCRGVRLETSSLCEAMESSFTPEDLARVEVYVLKKTQVQIGCMTISELCALLTEDSSVIELAQRFNKQWSLQLTVLDWSLGAAAVASVLRALDTLRREEAKQALIAQLSGTNLVAQSQRVLETVSIRVR